MGDLAIDTAVRARGDGLFEATLSADWEIWGPMGGYVAACALRAAGAVDPRTAAGRVLVSLPERCAVRHGRHPRLDAQARPHGVRATRRDHPGRARDPRRDGVERRRGRGPRTRRDGPARRPRPGSTAEHPRIAGRRPATAVSRSGTTSMRSRSSSRSSGHPTDRAPRVGRSGCVSCPPRRSTIRGSTRPAASFWWTCRVGRPQTARTRGSNPASWRPPSTSTSRSTRRRPATSGCCATAPRRSRRAASSVGPRASGRPAAACTRPAAANASTAACPSSGYPQHLGARPSPGAERHST